MIWALLITSWCLIITLAYHLRKERVDREYYEHDSYNKNNMVNTLNIELEKYRELAEARRQEVKDLKAKLAMNYTPSLSEIVNDETD